MQKCYRTFGNSSSLWQSLSGRMKLTPTVLKSAAVLMLLLLQVLKRQWPLLMKPVILFIIMKAWMLNANSIPGPANVWCIQCTVHAELCQCNYAQVCSNNAAGWLRIEKSRTSCSVRATKKKTTKQAHLCYFFFFTFYLISLLCVSVLDACTHRGLVSETGLMSEKQKECVIWTRSGQISDIEADDWLTSGIWIRLTEVDTSDSRTHLTFLFRKWFQYQDDVRDENQRKEVALKRNEVNRRKTDCLVAGIENPAAQSQFTENIEVQKLLHFVLFFFQKHCV